MILLIWIGIAHFTASISLLSLPGAPITADRRFHHFCDYLIFTTIKSHQQISRHTPLTLTATTKPTSLQPAVVEYKISHYRTQHSTLNPTQIAHKTAPGTHKNTPLADYFPFLCQIMNQSRGEYVRQNYNMNALIPLSPLVTLHQRNKNQPHQIQLHTDTSQKQKCRLLAVIGMTQQQLPLLGNFQFQHQEQQQYTVVFCSAGTVQVGSIRYRVVYIPASKTDHEIFLCFGDLFRQLADIVVSDINSAAVHKLKEKHHILNKHYVLSGDKDIYQVSLKDHSLELVRSIELPFLSSLSQQSFCDNTVRMTELGMLMEIVGEYCRSWQWVLYNKSWSVLCSFVLEHYKCMDELRSCSISRVIKEQNKMVSNKQLQAIRGLLKSISPSGSNAAILATVVESIMREVQLDNQKHIFSLLDQLRPQINSRSYSTLNELEIARKQIKSQLQLYPVHPQIIQTILLPQQQHIHQLIINNKNHIISHLQSNITSLQSTIHSRDQTIAQYHHRLQTQNKRMGSLHQLENVKCYLEQMLQNQTLRNQQLKIQLASSHLLQRKSLQSKVELENKIMQLKHQKEGLLQCLQELTQQNLSLLNQKQELQNSIKELKESLEQTTQIEVRALRSIENQAQIRTRLYRYEKYVSELKLSIQSFKKLQSEKFNYILAKNYQEFQQLQKKYNQALVALRREEKQSKTLNQSLQRERIRLNYFEKLLTSNYQHEPIPECSQENSETDRQTSPAVVVQ